MYYLMVGNYQGWFIQVVCLCKLMGFLVRIILKFYKGLFVQLQEVIDLFVIKFVGG